MIISYSQVPLKLRIKLVCLLEKHEDAHPVLVDVLMGAAMSVIDKMSSEVCADLPSLYHTNILLPL